MALRDVQPAIEGDGLGTALAARLALHSVACALGTNGPGPLLSRLRDALARG
jgi:hypothetical protein